jgi:hypothetical protein
MLIWGPDQVPIDILAVGADPVPAALQTSKGFGNYIRQDYEHMREAAKIAGLTPQ